MRHWAFDKDITKELIVACFTAGISASRMRRGGLPHITTIRQWRMADQEFNARFQAAANVQRKQFDWEKVRVALLAGHSLTALHKHVPDMPTWYEIIARAKVDPAWYAPIKQALAERENDLQRRRAERKSDLLRRLERGETLAAMVSRRLIGKSLLEKRRAYDAVFDTAIRSAIADRQAREKAQTAAGIQSQRTELLARKEEARQLRIGKAGAVVDPVYSSAEKAVPRTYPKDVRDDVISTIFLAVLEGEIAPEQIPAKAKDYISAYWRGRPEFHALSFDAPVGDSDGRLTLHDVIAQL